MKEIYTVIESDEDNSNAVAWKYFDNHEYAEMFADFYTNLYPKNHYNINVLQLFTDEDKEKILNRNSKIYILISATLDENMVIEDIAFYPVAYTELSERKCPNYTFSESMEKGKVKKRCSLRMIIERDKCPKSEEEITQFFISNMEELSRGRLVFKEKERTKRGINEKVNNRD